MSYTLEEQMERFHEIEDKLEKDRRQHNNLEARLAVQKEQYVQERKELEEQGITFKTGKELQKIYLEKKKRVEELLSEMESALGLDEEDDDEEEDFLDI